MAILYSKQKKHLKKSNFRIIFSDRFWLSFIALDVPISIFWVNSIQNQAKELTRNATTSNTGPRVSLHVEEISKCVPDLLFFLSCGASV